MKDGKFDNHLEMYDALFNQKLSIRHDSGYTYHVDDAGNIIVDRSVPYNAPASQFSIVPSQAYYIPKDNSFAYLILDENNVIQKAVGFDGYELKCHTTPIDKINYTPCTKEQAERRVNSWWKSNCKNPSDQMLVKIENGKMYSRRKGKTWILIEDFDDEYFSLISCFDPITRAECEAAFRETFGFDVAVKHLMSGKTVGYTLGNVEGLVKRINGDYRFKAADSDVWNLMYFNDSVLDAQYWLAE